jgi:hypothetical protein
MKAGTAAWRLASKERSLLDSLLEEMEEEDSAGVEGLHEDIRLKLAETEEARDAVAGALLDIKRRVDACRAEKKRLDKRINTMERLYERVENQVKETMKSVGLKSLEGATTTITAVTREDSKLEITDRDAILARPEFLKPPGPPEIDNSKVVEAIENGQFVTGARLRDTTFLKIR